MQFALSNMADARRCSCEDNVVPDRDHRAFIIIPRHPREKVWFVAITALTISSPPSCVLASTSDVPKEWPIEAISAILSSRSISEQFGPRYETDAVRSRRYAYQRIFYMRRVHTSFVEWYPIVQNSGRKDSHSDEVDSEQLISSAPYISPCRLPCRRQIFREAYVRPWIIGTLQKLFPSGSIWPWRKTWTLHGSRSSSNPWNWNLSSCIIPNLSTLLRACYHSVNNVDLTPNQLK